jgi:hypothetical protein
MMIHVAVLPEAKELPDGVAGAGGLVGLVCKVIPP